MSRTTLSGHEDQLRDVDADSTTERETIQETARNIKKNKDCIQLMELCFVLNTKFRRRAVDDCHYSHH